jgi:hypothetical protein
VNYVSYIVTKRFGAIRLTSKDGLFWHDADGTEFALRDDRKTLDLVDRCGLGLFSVPRWFRRITKACLGHEFKYSSPSYQRYYTREQADYELERDVIIMADGDWWGVLGKPFRWIAHKLGRGAWENKETR